MKNIIVTILLVSLVLSCNKTKDMRSASVDEIKSEKVHPGKKLIETNCYVCHSPSASQNDRIAPPMIAIKKHYLEEGMTKKQFINDMQGWIDNPIEDNAKMFGAVRRFGVMPKQVFPAETIKQISDYMFDNAIEQPEWFDEHFKKGKGKKRKM